MKKAVINLSLSIAVMLISVSPATLRGQTSNEGDITQYLFSEFASCKVLMKGGKTKPLVMNYNTVTEKMVFLSNDNYYDLTNPEAIDTVMLNDCKFIPVGKAFYEVLVTKPIALFIQHKANLRSAGKPVGYGGTSQTASVDLISSIELSGIQTNLPLPKDYIVNPVPVYLIRKGEQWSDFNNGKQFISLFPDKATQIKSFIRENRIKIDRPENLARLVRYVGTL